MRGEGSDDEAAEGAIELVRCCAEELGVGAFNMFVGGFAVLEVTVLPVSEAFRIGHFRLALTDGFSEGADSTLAALGKRSGVRVGDCVSVRATVASTQDDTFFAR